MNSPYTIEIAVSEPHQLQARLDAAVNQAVQEGLSHPEHGVLVTRHDYRTFTVELSHQVPQGTIQELDLCGRPGTSQG